jgi:hypothetical protein
MTRYRADEATVWVWDQCERTCLRWRSSEHWDDIRLSLKAYFPRHGDLSYSASRKLWSVPVWRRPALEEWLCRTFEPSAIRWDEQPPGESYGRTHKSGHSGYTRYGPSQSATTALERAYAELHLLPEAPAWAAEAVYRAAIKVHHPDAGGDGQTMVRINLAMECIRAYQEEKAS